MNRREFLGSAGALAAGLVSGRTEAALPEATAAHLPRWRGFNLLEKFDANNARPFRERDFAWMADWGFNFVRLPLSYRCWADPKSWRTLREPALKEIDQAVGFGRRYGIHVNLNFHRAPGYCVNPPAEPFSLWKDPEALDACCFHWAHFAERYRDTPNDRLSFNLLNEPGQVAETTYVRVIRRLVEAIRAKDPRRLILVDGLQWARRPVNGLVGLPVAQSVHTYDPMQVTHYRAGWVRGSNRWPVPTWPLVDQHKHRWDRAALRRQLVEPWKALEHKGVGVHVGEWGCHNRTPHQVVLDWMRDNLVLWKEAGWGWALWNLRGSFGVLDSGRQDVRYENYHGHKLDRPMLDLLRGA